MAGKKPYQAVQNFLAPLQETISCVSRAVIKHGGREYNVNAGPYALVAGGKLNLEHTPSLALDIRMQYKIVEASGDRGPYKVKITAYMYIVDDHQGQEIFSYHYPAQSNSPGVKFPHLHVEHPAFQKAHFPTGRISLEEVLKLLITDFRGGFGNSDRMISGSLASPPPPRGGLREERGDETNETESRRDL